MNTKRTGKMEGLEPLHLGQKELAQLEAMGITTLEQLAQSDRHDLGMGKNKGDALITRSHNILAIKHVQSICIQDDLVKVQVDLPPSRGVIAAIKSALRAYDDPSWGNCTLELRDTLLLFRQLQARAGQHCSYYEPSNYTPCPETSVDRCACHHQYFCQTHLDGHVPSIPQDFARITLEAQKLAERLHEKKAKALSDMGVTLPEEKIQSFARQRGLAGFSESVFGEIQGQEVMKQALALGVFSPPRDPVHVLVIGEPASAKTLAREILLQNFSGLTPVGGNATRAGLVCNRSTGELGALGFSDGKTVLVDEFDKIDPVDLGYCLELLSNGRCDVHSAKMHDTIESHFTMLAFANPEGDIFSGDLRADIGMRPTVMSRFALVVKVRSIQGEDLLNLFRRSLERKGELLQLPQYFDQWVKLGRLYEPAWRISFEGREHYLSAMVEIVEKHINTPLRRDIRMRDYLRRVPEAMARAEFSPVEDRHLRDALSLFQASLETWS